MKDYSTGIETKKRILETATELFYQKGFEATSYNDICSAAQVNTGTLHYHYKSKYGLAHQVMQGMIEKLNDIGSTLLSRSNSNPYLHFVMGVFLFTYYKFTDKQLSRFAAEVFAQTMSLDITHNYDETYLGLNFPKEDLDLKNPNDIVLLISVIAVDAVVPHYLSEHQSDFSWIEAAEKLLDIYGRILYASKNDSFYQAVQDAKSILITKKLPRVQWNVL